MMAVPGDGEEEVLWGDKWELSLGRYKNFSKKKKCAVTCGTVFKTNFLSNNNNKILVQMICLVGSYFNLFGFLKVGIFMV